MANVKLYYIDDQGNKRRISVNLLNYEIQELDKNTCAIINQRNGLLYTVKSSFDRLHYLSNGFSEEALN